MPLFVELLFLEATVSALRALCVLLCTVLVAFISRAFFKQNKNVMYVCV